MSLAVRADRQDVVEPPVSVGETRSIGRIDVAVVDTEAALRFVRQRLDAGGFAALGFLNAHCVNLAHQRADYRESLSGFTILPDGVGIDLASKILYGAPFPANLNGTDFVPLLLCRLEQPLRVALIGAEPGIAERAAGAFAALAPKHAFLPIAHGFFAEGSETEAVLERLRAAKADIVLVALGVPAQELFIARHLTRHEAIIAIGVGALFDFMAGKVSRAPRPIRKLRLEWVYRLALEPRRLWKRYVEGNPRFLIHIVRERRLRAAASR